MKITIKDLAALVGGQIFGGSGDEEIAGIASIADAVPGDISFFGNAKYLNALRSTRASAVLVPLAFSEEIAPVQIRVENPTLAFTKVLARFSAPPVQFPPGVHATAIVAEDAELGAEVSIQPHVVIERGAKIGARSFIGAGVYVGHGCQIGEDCRIHPNVTLRDHCKIGARVAIHSGTVIGSDGFGYEMANGRHQKIPQTGIVQIDDDVEIGANVAIDRARFGRTWIGEGTKIDNLVQIAHNVTIGKHSVVVSQAGISGSTRIGNYVILAGQTGLVGHIEVGDKAVVAAQGGVTKSVPAGETWAGYPARPLREFQKTQAGLKTVGKLAARVKKLEQLLDSNRLSSPPET